jgi:uncharacterized membrane protein YoaK (UPF0700 family)
LALFFGTYANYNYSSLNTGLVSMVLIAALSMGIQFICAKHVNRSGVVTTIITGTLSNLISRLINRGELTSDDLTSVEPSTVTQQSKHKFKHPTNTTLFLIFVWVGYFTGAASSAAALLLVSRSSAAAIPFVLVLVVMSYAGMRQLRKDDHK